MEQAQRPVDVCTFIFPRREAAKRRVRAGQTPVRSIATPRLKITSSSSQDIAAPAKIQFPFISSRSSEPHTSDYNHQQLSTSLSSIIMATSSSNDTFGAFRDSESMKTVINEQQTSHVSLAVERRLSSSPRTKLPLEETGRKRTYSSRDLTTGQYKIPATRTNKPASLDKRSGIVSTELLPAFEDEKLAPHTNRSSRFTVSAYYREDNTSTPNHRSRTNYSPSISSSECPSEELSLQKKPSASNLMPLTRSPTSSSTQSKIALNNERNTVASHVTRPILPRGELHPKKRRQAKVSSPIASLSSLQAVEYVKTIEIQLWIDQEEHRTIQPRFVFKRHTPRGSRSANNSRRPSTAQPILSLNTPDPKTRFWDNVTELGLVDLRMAEKEVGTFHCGKIAREAVIRRLVVNENDEKDFLSQNITLPLKQNGVYAVYGRESHRKDKSKGYVWKFEYMIEGKGVPNSNEKLLRPLSFICSPELLAPSQAMTVTLFQILSKAIAHSPTAKRVPPPSMPPVPISATGSDFSHGSDSSCASPVTSASRIAGTVKSFGRPTTPHKDIRLWTHNSVGRRSISSEVTTEHEYRPSKLGLPHRLHKKDKSSKRPHTAGPSYAEVRKQEEKSNGFKPPSRPATAVPSSSSLKSAARLGRIAWDATFKPRRRATDPQISSSDPDRMVSDDNCFPSYLGGTPSVKDIGQMLSCMKAVVIEQQQRLEMTTRRNSSKEKAAIERLDSETDIKISDESSIPSLHRSLFPGRSILSAEPLEAWITPSFSSSRRPSTAQGSSANGIAFNSSSRSTGSVGLSRPHTSAGHGEFNRFQVFSQSPNSSSTSLSLPVPPRPSPRRPPKDINPQP